MEPNIYIYILLHVQDESNKHLHVQDVNPSYFSFMPCFFFYLVGASCQLFFLLFCYPEVSCCLYFWFSATNNRTCHGSDVLMFDHGKVRASRRLISGNYEPWTIFVRATRIVHYKANRHSSLSMSRGYV